MERTQSYSAPWRRHILAIAVIFVIPFSNGLLSFNIMGITGAKILNILLLLIVFIMFTQRNRSALLSNKNKRFATFLYFLYVGVFTIAAFKALFNLDTLAIRYPEEFYAYTSSAFSFLLSYWLVPVLVTIMSYYTITQVRDERDVQTIIKAIALSVGLAAIIASLTLAGADLSGAGRNDINTALQSTFNLHYNTMGSFIILTAPLVLALGFQDHKKWFILFGVFVVTLFFLKSRGSMLGTMAGLLFYLFATGIFNARNAIFIGLALLIGFFAKDLILDMFDMQQLSGGKNVDSSNIDDISSGRIEAMWVPLLEESLTRPFYTIFGYGLIGVINTDVYITDYNFYQATHAHNAYLNYAIDMGWPFMLLLVSMSVGLIFKGLRIFRRNKQNALLLGCLSGYVGYLVSCFFGRFFTPMYDNYLLFVIVGCAVCLANVERLRLRQNNLAPPTERIGA